MADRTSLFPAQILRLMLPGNPFKLQKGGAGEGFLKNDALQRRPAGQDPIGEKTNMIFAKTHGLKCDSLSFSRAG